MRTTTRYWGLVFILGSLFPLRALGSMPREQSVPLQAPPAPTSPTPATSPTAAVVREGPFPVAGPVLTTLPKPPPYVWATLAWSQRFDATHGIALAATTQHIYAVTTNGDGPAQLSAHAIATGQPVWTHGERGWRHIVADAPRLFGLIGSRVVSMDARTGTEQWSLDVPADSQALTTVGDRLIVSGSRELLAVNLETGDVVWRQTVAGVATRPVIPGRIVVTGLAGGMLAGFSIVDGAERWRKRVGAEVDAMSSDGGIVYAALSNGSVCAYSGSDGALMWGCQRLRVRAVGAPLVDGDVVHVALLDNTLRTFDRRSGVTRRSVNLGQRPVGPAEASPQSVVVPLISGAFARVLTGRTTWDGIVAAEASAFVNLQRALVADGGRLLVSLNIPPGGALQMIALRLRDEPAAAVTGPPPSSR